MVTSRLAVMAHFDVHGEVAPHVRRHVEAWSGVANRLIVVTTAQLTTESRTWLHDRVTLVERVNYGYDFASYRAGLQEAGDVSGYGEVVLCNDSFVGPLRPYRRIFDEMAEMPVDFWGLTRCRRIASHVQSFFVVFRPWVVRSRTFTRFWSSLVPISDRSQVIRSQEVGLSNQLQEAGFVAGSYFVESARDQALARRRMQWWAAHRPPGIGIRSWRNGLLRKRGNEWWNPAIALADQALPTGRLPMVKIDTLRYDPYGLDAGHLLRACERAFPGHFADVREHLERTAGSYARRVEEVLLDTPLPLRPVRSLVRYAR